MKTHKLTITDIPMGITDDAANTHLVMVASFRAEQARPLATRPSPEAIERASKVVTSVLACHTEIEATRLVCLIADAFTD
jgi:hypothetical protein